MTTDPRKPVTAITLIDCFEECCPSDAGKGLWDEADTRHTRSSLCRLRQLKSLFRAFEIRFDPLRFEQGWFILEKRTMYDAMIARLTSQLPAAPSRPPRVRDLWRLFPVLRTYRRDVEAARHSYRMHKQFPPFVDLVVREAIIPASQLISVATSPVSGLLAELIAPDGRKFLLEDLIRDHGYPTEDYLELRQEEEEEFWKTLFSEEDEDAADT
jgi:hypothetical protein